VTGRIEQVGVTPEGERRVGVPHLRRHLDDGGNVPSRRDLLAPEKAWERRWLERAWAVQAVSA